MTKAIH